MLAAGASRYAGSSAACVNIFAKSAGPIADRRESQSMASSFSKLPVPQPPTKLSSALRLLFSRCDCRPRPVIHGMSRSAIYALRFRILSPTPWADGLGRECIESLSAVPTLPDVADRRSNLATRTGKTIPAGQFCKAQECPGLLESAPADRDQVQRDSSEPYVTVRDGKQDEPGYSKK